MSVVNVVQEKTACGESDFKPTAKCVKRRYDTDAILTCARKPTRVSLIYRTETTTKKCKTEKLKSRNGYAQK